MADTAEHLPSIRILGTRVHMAPMPVVMAQMVRWIETESQRHHHIVNTGMHGIMEAHRDPEFKQILNSADLLAPDGILTILIARLHGYRISKRDTGPELLWRFSEIGNRKAYKYFFYGDTEETLKLLCSRLQGQFPNVRTVGYHSPPFRTLTTQEDESVVHAINQAKPDVLWVGLGIPKQERWIAEHRDKLNVPVVVGAGASFKFLSGTVSRAPAWLRNLGFEWLWRLIQEPKRVWRRALIDAPQFIGLVFLQLTGMRKFG